MKVKVIGGGPAGSVAAISALRAGHSVQLFEEHAKAGYPQHCSGLISKEGLERLSDIADYAPYAINRISGAVFDFAGERFEIRRREDTAIVVDRAEFDRVLANRAEEEGARIFYGKRYSHSAHHCEGEAIIGADGAFSHTAAHFGFPKIGTFAFTLKAMARMQTEDASSVFLFYDNSNMPGFFGWLIPHNEREAEVGAGTTNPSMLRHAYQFMMKKTGAQPLEKPRGRAIPIAKRARIAAALGTTNVLLVGDAAGQVKSSSGGGVVFGTAAARLAGALVHSPSEYEAACSRLLGREIAAHALLRKFFAIQPNFSLRLMAAASRLLGLNNLFAAYGNMDYPTRIFYNSVSKAFNIPSRLNISVEPGDSLGDEGA